MKLRKILTIISLILILITVIALMEPWIEASALDGTLVKGPLENGATYSYKMYAPGPINFYKNSSLSEYLSDGNFVVGYINITINNNVASFNISLFGQNLPGQVVLAKSFVLNENFSSDLCRSFFPTISSFNGAFVKVFNLTAVNEGVAEKFSIINVPGGNIHTISHHINLINVPQQPTGDWEYVTSSWGANNAYYVQSTSGYFLSEITFSGNSTVIAKIFGSSYVSNVTLLYMILQKTNVAVEPLNTSYYLTRYTVVIVAVWILGIVYMISLYRRVSRKGR